MTVAVYDDTLTMIRYTLLDATNAQIPPSFLSCSRMRGHRVIDAALMIPDMVLHLTADG